MTRNSTFSAKAMLGGILTFVFFQVGTNSSAQECTFSNMYSPPQVGTWVQVLEGSKVPVGHSGFRGTGNFNGGQLNFQGIIGGGYDTRVRRNIGLLSNNWECELDVTIIAGSNFTAGAFNHVVLAFTSTNAIPYRNWVFPYIDGSVPVNTNHDAIGVQLISIGQTHYFYVTSNDDGINTDLCQIQIPYVLNQVPQSYHIVLQRQAGGTGRLEVSLNNGSFSESCCFVLPETVRQLRFLQHANRPTGGYLRSFTGNIVNTCIRDNYITEPCDVVPGSALIQSIESFDREDHETAVKSVKSTELEIFPNPAIDFLNLRLVDFAGENLIVRIYDLQGRLLETKRIANNAGIEFRYDISNLRTGAYQLVILTESQSVIDSKAFFKL